MEQDALSPENYAGEGFSDPDEIAFAGDVDDPWLRGRVEKPGYWPGRSPKRGKKR